MNAVAIRSDKHARRCELGYFHQVPAAFHIIDRLAVGGAAEIFRAVGAVKNGKQLVVVKRLTREANRDDGIKTLFELEADLGRRLTHPNIVQMLDMGFADGELFLVFDYFDGPNLQQLIDEARRRQIRLPFELVAAIMVSVLEALEFAHNLTTPDGQPMELIHRDVNTRNVLTDFNGRIALIDFGIARLQGFEGGREEDVIRGKLGSVAPEQLRNEPLDRRADLFAAGVLLYELAIGIHPFKGRYESEDAILNAILKGRFVSPHSAAPHLPKTIRSTITETLSPRVSRRPATAESIADVLRPHAAKNPQAALVNVLCALFPKQLTSAESLRFLHDI